MLLGIPVVHILVLITMLTLLLLRKKMDLLVYGNAFVQL